MVSTVRQLVFSTPSQCPVSWLQTGCSQSTYLSQESVRSPPLEAVDACYCFLVLSELSIVPFWVLDAQDTMFDVVYSFVTWSGVFDWNMFTHHGLPLACT